MEFIDQFESAKEEDFEGAVSSLYQDMTAVNGLRDLLRSQIQPESFTQGLFEWLYRSIQLRERSTDLYTFVLQFAPDLLLVYLHAVYENSTKLKAMSEAPLLGLLMELEKEKAPQIQVPTLAKASIYHKTTVQLTHSGLTEANLLRHNQTEYTPSRPFFTDKKITVNNRLPFLSTVVDVFADHMTMFCHESKVAFCEACIRLAVQGMGPFFSRHLPGNIETTPTNSVANVNLEELSTMKRFSVSDSLVTSLLRGIRMCLFQSCHSIAMEALSVLKLRAEYELLTTAIQVSHALLRLTSTVEPMEVKLEVNKQSCYHGDGTPKFENNPSKIHSVLNGHILHCKLVSAGEANDTQEQPVIPRQVPVTLSSLRPDSKSTDV